MGVQGDLRIYQISKVFIGLKVKGFRLKGGDNILPLG